MGRVYSLAFKRLNLLNTQFSPFSFSADTYLSGGSFSLGRDACRAWIFSDYFFCTVSVLSIVAVARDREEAVTNPVEYAAKVTGRQVGESTRDYGSEDVLRVRSEIWKDVWYITTSLHSRGTG